jgi:uncharacterized protein YkwD
MCARDEALSAAASALLMGPRDLSAASITHALREAGSDAPLAHAIVVPTDGLVALRNWMTELLRTTDAPLICGDASNGRERLRVVSTRAGSLESSPQRPAQFRVRVSAPFRDARAVALDSHGGAHTLEITGTADERFVVVPDDLSSPLLLQLVAVGPQGPRPVAERAIGAWRDVSAAGDAGASLESRVDAMRARDHLSALRPNRLLQEVAARHARSVCESGRVGHTVEPGADPEARLRAQGMVARVVGETVARARDNAAAFQSFVASPSHHATLADPRFTDIGVASESDAQGRQCVVIMLAAWPRIVPAN